MCVSRGDEPESWSSLACHSKQTSKQTNSWKILQCYVSWYDLFQFSSSKRLPSCNYSCKGVLVQPKSQYYACCLTMMYSKTLGKQSHVLCQWRHAIDSTYRDCNMSISLSWNPCDLLIDQFSALMRRWEEIVTLVCVLVMVDKSSISKRGPFLLMSWGMIVAFEREAWLCTWPKAHTFPFLSFYVFIFFFFALWSKYYCFWWG